MSEELRNYHYKMGDEIIRIPGLKRPSEPEEGERGSWGYLDVDPETYSWCICDRPIYWRDLKTAEFLGSVLDSGEL